MNATISNVLTGVLVVCALIVTGLYVRQEFSSPSAPEEPVVNTLRGWESLTQHGHTVGPDDAPIQIVSFSDFECPFCKRTQPVLKRIQNVYGDSVAITYRHMILKEAHPHARTAALAVECAGEQGVYEPYHRLLYQHADDFPQSPWTEIAEQAGVQNLTDFQSCVDNETYASRLDRDQATAKSLGLTSIPTLVINGSVMSGAYSFMEYDRVIQDAVSDTR